MKETSMLQITLEGPPDRYPELTWRSAHVPRVGDYVEVPTLHDQLETHSLLVRSVTWVDKALVHIILSRE